MVKRFLSFIASIMLLLAITSCGSKPVLLFLNWGEYIDEDMISAFEKKENCIVLMDLAESNELFYSKVRAGTTVYDVVAPSDYMVEKMYKNDMLEKIDFSKLESYNPDSDNVRLGVKAITKTMQENTKNIRPDDDIKNYFVPYLWGTWGLMYSTKKEGLEDAVKNSNSPWSSLFDRNALPKGTKVSMYDSHQHAYYAACKYLGFPVDKELTHAKLDRIESLVKEMHYDAWGTDNLKKDIVAGNIDLGFMWTGDFLYYYCENIAKIVINAYLNGEILVSDIKTMIDSLVSEGIYIKNDKQYEIGFDLYIPDDTITFVDSFVITKNAANKDLAYKFIDFMSSNSVDVMGEEYKPAFNNAYYVCYDTPFVNVYNDILNLKNKDLFNQNIIDSFNKHHENPYDTALFKSLYDYANALAFDKYYPLDCTKGNKLNSFSREYVDIINTTFYNARI